MSSVLISALEKTRRPAVPFPHPMRNKFGDALVAGLADNLTIREPLMPNITDARSLSD
jgi:hypothetical protein